MPKGQSHASSELPDYNAPRTLQSDLAKLSASVRERWERIPARGRRNISVAGIAAGSLAALAAGLFIPAGVPTAVHLPTGRPNFTDVGEPFRISPDLYEPLSGTTTSTVVVGYGYDTPNPLNPGTVVAGSATMENGVEIVPGTPNGKTTVIPEFGQSRTFTDRSLESGSKIVNLGGGQYGDALRLSAVADAGKTIVSYTVGPRADVLGQAY